MSGVTGLAYVRPVACQFVHAAFVVVLRCVVDFGFGQLWKCVCAFKDYLYVSLFEEVGYLSDFGTVISEGGPFIVVAVVSLFYVVLVLSVWLCDEWGIYCCLLCFVFFAILLFSFQLRVVVTISC